MAKKKVTKKRSPRKKLGGATFKLPTGRREPEQNPFAYAYLLTGEKKIGKTTFAIEGAEEMVLQFDKPQLAYEIREVMIESWQQTLKSIGALEDLAKAGKFEFDRIVIDGAGEMYQMCQVAVCKHFGVQHPSEEGYARAWHKLRDDYTDAINRLLRLQNSQGCGLIFIAHSEWKEKPKRGGGTIERLVPNLPSRAEEILNGKCDAWFQYDYYDDQRIMVVRGDEATAAGHRIDGHFNTVDGEPMTEILMGRSASEAYENFLSAFNNELTYTKASDQMKAERRAKKGPTKKKVTKKKVTKKKSVSRRNR